MNDPQPSGPAVFPTVEEQREATRDARRGAAVNRRTFDRASGQLESVAEAQARYAELGLETTTPLDLRDDGNPAHMPSRARPVDQHAEAESPTAEEHAETLRKYGFQP